MPKLDIPTLQLILVAVVALAFVVQAIVLVLVLVAVRKLARSLTEEVQDLRSAVMPIVDTTRNLVERLAPKIQETTADLAVLTRALRDQAADVQAAADDIIARARNQVGRVDSMLTSLLDAVDRATVFMADAVSKPMRQLSAFLASAKAVVESLRNNEGPHRAPANRSSSDHDMFV